MYFPKRRTIPSDSAGIVKKDVQAPIKTKKNRRKPDEEIGNKSRMRFHKGFGLSKHISHLLKSVAGSKIWRTKYFLDFSFNAEKGYNTAFQSIKINITP